VGGGEKRLLQKKGLVPTGAERGIPMIEKGKKRGGRITKRTRNALTTSQIDYLLKGTGRKSCGSSRSHPKGKLATCGGTGCIATGPHRAKKHLETADLQKKGER